MLADRLPDAIRRAALLTVLGALSIASPAAAQNSPWEPSQYDNEGPYIFEGSIGVPNVRVDIIEVSSMFHPPISANAFSDERTGPQGQFRLDVGSCPVNFNCRGGGGEYQIVFHRLDQGTTPRWAPNKLARADGQKWNLPEVENGLREHRKSYNVTGGASFTPYTTISGTVRGTDGKPFDGAWVQMYDEQGRNYFNYTYPAFRVGDMYTTGGGKYTMRVPPGKWALWFKEKNFNVIKWYGCTPTQAGAAYVDTTGGPATGVDMDFSKPDCGGPTSPGDPGGPGGPGTPDSGKVALTKASVTFSETGAATLTVKAPGPGKLSATATGPAPKASAAARTSAKGKAKKKKKPKTFTIAKGSATVSKAGTVKLVLKPTKAAQKLLKKGRKLKATVKITFTPKSGKASTVTKSLTFKAAKKKPKPKKRR